MTPKAGDRWAAIDVRNDVVRLLVARLRAPEAASGPSAQPEVRHQDDRVRFVGPEDRAARASATPEATMLEIESAIMRYVRVAERADARIVAFAPRALTVSEPGMALFRRLEAEVALPIRPLSERREGELAFLGVGASLDDGPLQAVVDLQPDRTAVSIAQGRTLVSSCALPIGGATVALELADPPSPLEWALASMRYGSELAAIPMAAPSLALVTGDGGHTLAGFDLVRGPKTQAGLTIADLDRMTDDALRTSARKIARRTGDDPRRVALIAPSALLLAGVLQRFGLERCTVVPSGLRDGVVLAAAADPDGWWRDAEASIAFVT